MKSHSLAVVGALATASLSLANAPSPPAAAHSADIGRITVAKPLYDTGVRSDVSRPLARAAAPPSIPMFHRTVTDGRRTFPYTMVGKDPFVSHVSARSTVDAVLVPVVILMHNGDTFDPTVADSCARSSSISRTLASPLFTRKKYRWGGKVVGTGQFVSVFRRAEFYAKTRPNGLNPDLQVRLAPTTVRPIKVKVPETASAEGQLTCGRLGAIEIAWWDGYIRRELLPTLADRGYGSDTFAIFELSNVVQYVTTTSTCCVLGYHSAFSNPADGGITTYVSAMFDNTHGRFSGSADISGLSHEIAEWMDDPLVDGVDNKTRRWGHIGQVSGCQTTLEVGDPLSGMLQRTRLGGRVWHPQELAFHSWFYHRTPSLGVNGWFSSKGTFTADARRCT